MRLSIIHTSAMAEITGFVDWLPQNFRLFATIASHTTRVCAGRRMKLFDYFHSATLLYRFISIMCQTMSTVSATSSVLISHRH